MIYYISAILFALTIEILMSVHWLATDIYPKPDRFSTVWKLFILAALFIAGIITLIV